jgi:transcription antitermination protein NusB
MNAARRASRHRSREAALQILYALDLTARSPDALDPEAAERVFTSVAEHFELPEGARAFAKELVNGVCGRREALDLVVAKHAFHWRLERMAAVDRNVLRLGAYEILHTETPPQVAIDEALELARRFGGEHSPSFVNGILDAIARASGRTLGGREDA